MGVGGLVDGRVDEIAISIVIFAAHEELEFGVFSRVIDDFLEFAERLVMDDWADEAVEGLRWTYLEGLGFLDELAFEFLPEGGRDVGAGGGAAFLTLVFECAADGVDDGVVDIGAIVDQVVILTSCFANDPGVAPISTCGDPGRNFAE